MSFREMLKIKCAVEVRPLVKTNDRLLTLPHCKNDHLKFDYTKTFQIAHYINLSIYLFLSIRGSLFSLAHMGLVSVRLDQAFPLAETKSGSVQERLKRSYSKTSMTAANDAPSFSSTQTLTKGAVNSQTQSPGMH